MFFVQTCGRAVNFAHDHRKLSARIAEHCGPIYALNPIQDKRPAGTCSIGEVLFSQAVRVPGNKRCRQAGQRQTCFSVLEQRVSFGTQEEKGGYPQSERLKPASSFHLTSGESKNATLSWQPASGFQR